MDNKPAKRKRGSYNYQYLLPKQKAATATGSKVNWDLILKVVGILFVVPTLIISYCNYKQAEKWKLAEFAGKEFSSFKNDPSIKAVSTMLDYNKCHVKLFDNKDALYFVTSSDLKEALLVDSIKHEFTMEERQIRDLFDHYFDQLSLFEGYLETDLLTMEQVRPYIGYQIGVIADTTNNKKDNEFRKILWLYIYNYFPSVKRLCNRFVPYSIDTLRYLPTTVSKDIVLD